MRIPVYSFYFAPPRRRPAWRRRGGAFKRGVKRNSHLARLKAEKRGGEGGEGGEWSFLSCIEFAGGLSFKGAYVFLHGPSTLNTEEGGMTVFFSHPWTPISTKNCESIHNSWN